MLQEIPGHSREEGLEGDARPVMFSCPFRNPDTQLLVGGSVEYGLEEVLLCDPADCLTQSPGDMADWDISGLCWQCHSVLSHLPFSHFPLLLCLPLDLGGWSVKPQQIQGPTGVISTGTNTIRTNKEHNDANNDGQYGSRHANHLWRGFNEGQPGC